MIECKVSERTAKAVQLMQMANELHDEIYNQVLAFYGEESADKIFDEDWKCVQELCSKSLEFVHDCVADRLSDRVNATCKSVEL